MQMSVQAQDKRSQASKAPELQETMMTLVADENEPSAQGRLVWEPALLWLVGADVLERHVGGGRNPVGA